MFSTNFTIVYLPPPPPTHTHTLKQKPPKRKTPQYSQQRRPKGAKGRETHALQKQQQQQQLGTHKNFKKKDEKSYQRLYQCTHWHPIDAEKRSAYYMCMVELVLFIFSVLDMCVLSSQLVPTILKIS